MGLRDLVVTDQEGETAPRCDVGGSDRKNYAEALDRAQSDESGLWGEVFSTPGEYIDVCQCKRPDHLAKEGDFLVLGFEKGGAESWRPELDGKTGEACAGADIEEIKGGLLRPTGEGARRSVDPIDEPGREEGPGGE